MTSPSRFRGTEARRRRRGRRLLGAALSAAVAVTGCLAGTAAAAAPTAATKISLAPVAAAAHTEVTGDNVGFSVESADLAHGFLTKPLLANWLRTLGPHGVIRLGGYSMDLVWPAFGAYRDTVAPPEAIGGTVDQSDFDKLKKLLDATGWKVTLGLPLKKLIDPSKIKDPTKDPSPAVAMDQVVAEVKAAQRTLGSDLLSVEIGNEYDNVTTLTAAEYYAEMKRFSDAINAAVHPHVQVTGPSANTATTNTRLDDFITAVQADGGTDPRHLISELTNHLYAGSHCGSSTLSIPTLMSAKTHTTVQGKVDGIADITGRLNDGMPSVLNETNSASCSGMPGVSDAYATSLWSLDYVLQATQAGIARLQFHTNTAAMCGDFQQRTSPNYPISYRYYGAFCAKDQAALGRQRLSAAPLYYGLWAASQVPTGTFLDVGLPEENLDQLRAYAVQGDDNRLTMVLINVQDPAAAQSTTDDVAVTLPAAARHGRAVTLQSTGGGGLASLDAAHITLGGRSVANGVPDGTPRSTPVDVSGTHATVQVAPGTAQLVTFSR